MANEHPTDEPAARVSERLRHRDRGVQAAGAGSDQGETPAAAGPAGVSDIGGDATMRGYDLMRPGAPSDPGGDSSTAAASTKHTRGICEWEPLTCLVVEDDDSVRELCEQTLTDAGHQVVSVASAEEALEFVATNPGGNGGGRVRLVITDVVLPGMNGDELAAELTRQFPEMRTLYVSGHDPAELGIDPPDVALLAKPFTPEQLTAAAALASTAPGWPASDSDLNDLMAVTDRKSGSVIGVGPHAAAATTGDHPSRSGPRNTFGTGWSFPPEHVRRALRRFTPPGFGTFTVSKRVAAIAAAAGIAVLATAALVLAGGGGDVELTADEAGDVEIEEAAASDGERDAGEGDDPEGQTQDGDGNQQSGVVSGDDDPQTQDQAGSDNSQTATVEGDDNQQTQTQSGDAGTQAGGTAASEPTAAYEAPTVGAPQLTSCTTSRGDDGTTEYAVAYTVATTGGTYDVLPDEPFIGNDQRLEVRGGDLTWTVETIHVREAGDGADPFYVAAPDVLGWAEPGGDVRQHAHQPPPLEVYVDQCRG